MSGSQIVNCEIDRVLNIEFEIKNFHSCIFYTYIFLYQLDIRTILLICNGIDACF